MRERSVRSLRDALVAARDVDALIAQAAATGLTSHEIAEVLSVTLDVAQRLEAGQFTFAEFLVRSAEANGFRTDDERPTRRASFDASRVDPGKP